MKRLALLCLCFLFTACSIAPRDMGGANMVLLRSLPAPDTCGKRLRGGLTVVYPTLPDALDTYRIGLIYADGRADYYANMRWVDFLAGQVQASLQGTLGNTHPEGSVVSDDQTANSYWQLASDIRHFNAVYPTAGGAPTANIEIDFTLRVHGALRGRSFVVTKQAKASADSAAAIRMAFETAWTAAQQDMVYQLLGCKR